MKVLRFLFGVIVSLLLGVVQCLWNCVYLWLGFWAIDWEKDFNDIGSDNGCNNKAYCCCWRKVPKGVGKSGDGAEHSDDAIDGCA